jgi:hypothetical protein
MLDALIIAPEITKGMKSVGSKALLKIRSSLFVLEYQIQQLKKLDKKINITIATGFESDKIKKIFGTQPRIDIIYNEHYQKTNQAKCLGLFLEQYGPKPLLVISNGVLFKNFPFFDTDRSKIFLIDKPKANFTIGCSESEKIEYLFYDLPTQWSECVFLNQEATSTLKDMFDKHLYDQMYLFELLNTLISHNIHFDKNILSKKNIMKINGTKDISRAKIFI